MSPARSECSTRSWTSAVDALRAGVAEHGDRVVGQPAAVQHARAQRVVDVVVEVGDAVDDPDDPSLERRRLGARPEWQRMPSRTALVEVQRPRGGRRRAASARSGGSREPKRSRRQASSASSPMWPNGGWPRSWPRPIASVEVLVEAERPRDGARDLRDLERVGQPRAVVVALGGDEDLRLVLEPPERAAVHDPVAVALERRAQPAVGLGDRTPRGVGPRRRRREPGLLPRGTTRRVSRGDGAGWCVGVHTSIVAAPGADLTDVPTTSPRAGARRRGARRSR